MNIEIKKLESNNINIFTDLILLFEDVFEMKNFKMPGKDYLQQLLQKDDFIVFTALSDNEVVGGLTAYVLQQYYSTQALVYIYDLAVKTRFQRQGIGKKLISAVNGYSKSFGAEEVFVQADEVDDHAVKFYHSTGGKPEKVVHFYYPLNQ